MQKDEILRATLLYLKETPHTSVEGIRSNIKRILEARGQFGEVTTGDQYMRMTRFIDLSDQVALLIEEVIWDLIVERVLTPGTNAANLGFPWVHVSSMQKLENILRSY